MCEEPERFDKGFIFQPSVGMSMCMCIIGRYKLALSMCLICLFPVSYEYINPNNMAFKIL